MVAHRPLRKGDRVDWLGWKNSYYGAEVVEERTIKKNRELRLNVDKFPQRWWPWVAATSRTVQKEQGS